VAWCGRKRRVQANFRVGDSWLVCQLSLAEGIRKATSDVIITPDNAPYEGDFGATLVSSLLFGIVWRKSRLRAKRSIEWQITVSPSRT
jgi:hypothetical protein